MAEESLIYAYISDVVREAKKVVKKLDIAVMPPFETPDYYIASVLIDLAIEGKDLIGGPITLKNYAEGVFVVNKHNQKVKCLWISSSNSSDQLNRKWLSNTGKSIFLLTEVAEWAGGRKYPGRLHQIDLATGNTRSKYNDGKDEWHGHILLKPESLNILRALDLD